MPIAIPPPGSHRLWLPVTAEVRLPLLIASGAGPGPVLAVSAGVHGDEYEGVRALYELFEELDPRAMRGSLIAAPVVNPPAHRSCSRTGPEDGLNLARVFPGNAEGSISERIAHAFAHEVITVADLYADLHSGGVRFAMPAMAGYEAGDAASRAAAEAFGAPVLWGHPIIEGGRTISFARSRGIPSIYVEAWGAGRIGADDLRMMKRGVRNLLRHLGILDEPVEPGPAPRRLFGAGNTDGGITASAGGFLILEAKLLDRVGCGARLGRLVDLQGRIIEYYHAPRSGTIALTREMPAVAKGDTLFLLADEDE